MKQSLLLRHSSVLYIVNCTEMTWVSEESPSQPVNRSPCGYPFRALTVAHQP